MPLQSKFAMLEPFPNKRTTFSTNNSRGFAKKTPVAKNEKREQNMHWLFGPGGVDVSSVGQTMAELIHSEPMSDNPLALSFLRRYSLTTATLHAKERNPLPRCHPGTRVELRQKVHAWLTDENREQNMMWLFGPAGVGKSAVAQTIGELAEELGIFGAAIFFSRGRNVDNTSLFVTSIAYQLARQHRSYEQLVFDVLKRNRGIPNPQDKRAQFRKLFIEPFHTLKHQGKSFPKPLIIIDGLDECKGDTRQMDLVRLIVDAVEDFDSPPFLWLICSRPEHHLKEFFLDGGLSNICLEHNLLPHEPGADADVERYLVDGLERIAQNYLDRHETDTASLLIRDSEKLSKLVHTVSGVFIIASLILAFVGNPVAADPVSRLQIVLSVVDGSVTDGSGQIFLAPIDALYVGVLQTLEKKYRSQALQILGTCVISPAIPALHLANLLGITQEEFYSALRPLHAFLSIPLHREAVNENLHFFHASFPDFLVHHTRSGEYFQDSDVHRFRLVEACFYALNSTSTTYIVNLSWLPQDSGQDEDDGIAPESPLAISHDILSLAAMHTWDLCSAISKPQKWESLLKMAANFDFRCLQPFSDVLPVQPFIRFIRWIYLLGKEALGIAYTVRTRRSFSLDTTLLEKCDGISQPLNLDSTDELNELEMSPRYVLAGFEAMTVVILFIPEAVMIYSINDIDQM